MSNREFVMNHRENGLSGERLQSSRVQQIRDHAAGAGTAGRETEDAPDLSLGGLPPEVYAAEGEEDAREGREVVEDDEAVPDPPAAVAVDAVQLREDAGEVLAIGGDRHG